MGFPLRVRFCRRSINRASSDQLWASLSPTTLDFKQPLHQLGEVFHNLLPARLDWLAEIIGGSQDRKLVKSGQFNGIPGRKVFPPFPRVALTNLELDSQPIPRFRNPCVKRRLAVAPWWKAILTITCGDGKNGDVLGNEEPPK